MGSKTPKDAVITNNFNQLKAGGLSEKELKKLIKRQESGVKLAKKRWAGHQPLTNEEKLLKQKERSEEKRRQKAEEAERMNALTDPAVPAPDVKLSAEDEKSAYQMLQDMRWVYQKVKGRDKLKRLMDDDKEFKFMVKELLKIEAALLSAKIRAKEDPSVPANQMVFVVLKGLEDEVRVNKAMRGGDDKTVDMKQIAHALNPEGGLYELDAEEENKGDRPDEIIKKVEGIEDVGEW